MKDAVPQGIDLEIGDAARRITGAGEHVVPLENLMQDYPVEKTTEPDAQKDTRGDWKVVPLH